MRTILVTDWLVCDREDILWQLISAHMSHKMQNDHLWIENVRKRKEKWEKRMRMRKNIHSINAWVRLWSVSWQMMQRSVSSRSWLCFNEDIPFCEVRSWFCCCRFMDSLISLSSYYYYYYYCLCAGVVGVVWGVQRSRHVAWRLQVQWHALERVYFLWTEKSKECVEFGEIRSRSIKTKLQYFESQILKCSHHSSFLCWVLEERDKH